ncbi:hypothetical protein DBR39_07265 [Chryseobacterium sp. KBW03]|nr:hypothetical protein DBR39_07265 [Chryseobacterium sp. KBW03]
MYENVFVYLYNSAIRQHHISTINNSITLINNRNCKIHRMGADDHNKIKRYALDAHQYFKNKIKQ